MCTDIRGDRHVIEAQLHTVEVFDIVISLSFFFFSNLHNLNEYQFIELVLMLKTLRLLFHVILWWYFFLAILTFN